MREYCFGLLTQVNLAKQLSPTRLIESEGVLPLGDAETELIEQGISLLGAMR